MLALSKNCGDFLRGLFDLLFNSLSSVMSVLSVVKLLNTTLFPALWKCNSSLKIRIKSSLDFSFYMVSNKDVLLMIFFII